MTTYTKPNTQEKLTKSQILDAMSNGAILSKIYCVYSYYVLTFLDGSKHYNLRKDAIVGINERSNKNIVLLEANKSGISYKMINN
jgi:hypothetical protein